MNYEIIKSNRKSISVTVYFDNRIVVRCPKKTTVKQIENFLAERAKWLQSKIAGNALRNAENSDIISNQRIYVQGEKVPLYLGSVDLIYDDCVIVKDYGHIKKVFIEAYEPTFLQYVRKVAKIMRLRPASIKLKSFRSKWGCCDESGNLTFNYRIFMLSGDIMRYVVLHELCHMIYFDHSDKFWRKLARYEPDYARLKEQLKSFDFLTRLY